MGDTINKKYFYQLQYKGKETMLCRCDKDMTYTLLTFCYVYQVVP